MVILAYMFFFNGWKGYHTILEFTMLCINFAILKEHEV